MRKIWKSVFAGNDVLPVASITHPRYDQNLIYWQKYRYTFEGGHDFVQKYLKQFSTKENMVDFIRRREISYCPAFAKAGIIEIRDAIYQRLIDIQRKGGPKNYISSCAGEDNGVDYNGNSMSSFIGRMVLPELLSMARVGVYIDKDPVDIETSLATAKGIRPYIYMYPTESIKSWAVSKQGILMSVLLEDNVELIDELTGLITNQTKSYRLLQLTAEGVTVKFYDRDSRILPEKSKLLKLKTIPFVIFELTHSLLVDVADYQIALLQLASSDIHYSWKANYPFYVEQFDIAAEMSMLRQASPSNTENELKIMNQSPALQNKIDTSGRGSEAQISKAPQVDLGTGQGRRYPKGLDQPAFIHPSAEPLMASMKKQDQMKAEIRQLINLALASVEAQSAQSKMQDTKGLEAGLSYIGLELEFGERKIAEIWSQYEGSKEVITVSYPTNYSLKTDEERRKEAADLRTELPNLPSKTYQKELGKQIIDILLAHKVNAASLTMMKKEIDESPVVVTDPDVIMQDFESGFVGLKMASELRGYPKGQADLAKADHAERLARIAAAQSDPQSRGLKDASGNPVAGKTEKKQAGMKDMMDTPTDNTRGGGE